MHKFIGPQPRMEARPFPFENLTLAQRDVAKRATALLRSMCESDYEPISARRAKRISDALRLQIDADRPSRVLLFDGQRGSGKTSVLLTVLKPWSETSLLELPSRRAESHTEALASALENPYGRIVPVGLVDLQPLSDSINLLQLIAGHFAYLVDALDGAYHQGGADSLSAAWQGGMGRELASRAAWRKLIATIAGGWDRNLQQRGAQLDLEAYTLEFEQRGRHQLDLPFLFRDFIDALISDLRARYSLSATDTPLFVLAIDDADMVPQRAVELLWTVRALWHPRVAFLLTGDSGLFRMELRQNALGELLRPISHRPVPDHAMSQDHIATYASRMANEAYEKIIPPHHRLELSAIEPRDRLDFKLYRPSATESGATAQTLREMLKQIKVPLRIPNKERTLGDYFDVDPLLAEALPERLRRMLDLATRLEEAARKQQGASEPEEKEYVRAVSDAVLAIWRTALLAEDPVMSEQLEFLVSIDPQSGALVVGSTRRSVQLWTALNIDTEDRDSLSAYGSKTDRGSVSVQLLSLRKLTAKIAVPDEKTKGVNERDLEADGVLAALRLAANVAADQIHGRREALSWTPEGSGLRPLLAAGEFVEGPITRRFAWPLPRELSFVDLAVLNFRWQQVLRSLAVTAPLERDAIVRSFLGIVLATYAPELDLDWTGPASWDALLETVGRLMERGQGSGTRSERTLAEYLRNRLGLLFAPESGLYDILLKVQVASPDYNLALEWLGNQSIAGMKLVRRQRINLALIDAALEQHNRNAEELEKDFNSIFENQEWREAIAANDDDPAREIMKQTLADIGLDEHLTQPDRDFLLSSKLISNGRRFNDSLVKFADSRLFRAVALWQSACDVANAGNEIKSIVQYADGYLCVDRLYQQQDIQAVTKLSTIQSRGVLSVAIRMGITKSLRNTLLTTLFRAFWDLRAATQGSTRILSDQLWPLCQIKYLENPTEIRWPMVQWRIYKPLVSLLIDWNRLVKYTPFDSPAVPRHMWIDMLAYWLIEEQVALALMLPSPEPRLELKAENWKSLCQDVAQRLNDGIAQEKKPPLLVVNLPDLELWWKEVPLLACPEYGLSDIAAEGLMSYFNQGQEAKSGRAFVDSLQEQRISHFMSMTSGPKDRAEAVRILNSLDEKVPNHPFVRLRRENATQAAPAADAPAKRRTPRKPTGKKA